MKLSIVIPVYNEEKTLLDVLNRVENVDIGNIEKEIIIVDDYSTDSSRDILRGLVEKYKVIFQDRNYGKGKAVRTGFEHATGDFVVIQDADLEYRPEEYGMLLQPIIEGRTKVVYGSRFLRKHKAKYKLYYLGNVFLSYVTRLLYFRKITDMETCYKVFKKEVIDDMIPRLKAQRFDFEPEITAKLIKRGYKIIEVPIWYQCRDFKEGKKITWKDGVKAFWYLVKYRVSD
ncbi:glycosyltransferase family 2 protein [Candidatus Woesearchaeota archaeon]|nr:glycosyltransferase family 2 protein [Candidatus Woesearchaeota archaeon]